MRVGKRAAYELALRENVFGVAGEVVRVFYGRVMEGTYPTEFKSWMS